MKFSPHPHLIYKICFALLLSISFVQVHAQELDTAKLFKRYDHPGPGGVTTITNSNGRSATFFTGYANLETKKKIDVSSLFWMASVTKQFTAYAIYVLEQKGLLNRKDMIRNYLPELDVSAGYISINNLLQHSSGLRDGFVLAGLDLIPESSYTNDVIFKQMCRQTALNFEPGKRYEYNNGGYVLLTKIIERVSEKSFPEFVKENIFDKLGMRSSFIARNYPGNAPQICKGYRISSGKVDQLHFTGSSYGSTGLISSIVDMKLWAIFLNQILLTEKNYFRIKKDGNYDMGLERHLIGGHQIYTHFGSDPGFKSQIILEPAKKILLIAMSNDELLYGMTGSLLSILYAETGKSNKIIAMQKTAITNGIYLDRNILLVKKIETGQNGKLLVHDNPTGNANVFDYDGRYYTDGKVIPRTMEPKNKTLIFKDPKEFALSNLELITWNEDKIIESKWTGKYKCASLNTEFIVKEDNGELQLSLNGYVKFNFKRIDHNLFTTQIHGITFLEFDKDEMFLTLDGIQRLKLSKI